MKENARLPTLTSTDELKRALGNSDGSKTLAQFGLSADEVERWMQENHRVGHCGPTPAAALGLAASRAPSAPSVGGTHPCKLGAHPYQLATSRGRQGVHHTSSDSRSSSATTSMVVDESPRSSLNRFENQARHIAKSQLSELPMQSRCARLYIPGNDR